MYRKYFKRLFDIVFSFVALIVLSPVLLIVALLVKIKLGSPVIFKQKRTGKDDKVFTIYKFRTMTDQRNENGILLNDEERLTKFGCLLRSMSVDELLELFNVLKGDMSIVGPRPLLEEYLPLYNEEQRRRHEVKPGLTGFAQVNGRNAIDWDTRLKYDIDYIHNLTFTYDIKIIAKTFVVVINRAGISAENSVIIEPPTLKKEVVTVIPPTRRVNVGIESVQESMADVNEFSNV